MLKEFAQFLAQQAAPQIIQVEGRDYSSRELHPVREPLPATLEVTTLNAVVDYIKENRDGLLLPLIVHVASPTEVRVLGPLEGQFRQRPTYLVAKALLPRLMLDKYLDSTDFQIMLRSAFLAQAGDNETENARDTLIKIAGNVVETEALTSEDDGMSQTVTVMTGIATKAYAKLPNPAILRPYRTFPEVVQPSSEFIFRMGKGPRFALFEGDGGVWRLAAVRNVAGWLRDRLAQSQPGISVIY